MKTSDAGFGLSGAGNVGHIQKNCVVVPHLPVIPHCFEEKWGIYKKMLFLCPLVLKKGIWKDTFSIYTPRIILYMPGQSYFFFDSV